MRSNLRSVILSEHLDAREACDVPGFARQGESKDLSLLSRTEPAKASTPRLYRRGGYQPPAVPTAETCGADGQWPSPRRMADLVVGAAACPARPWRV